MSNEAVVSALARAIRLVQISARESRRLKLVKMAEFQERDANVLNEHRNSILREIESVTGVADETTREESP